MRTARRQQQSVQLIKSTLTFSSQVNQATSNARVNEVARPICGRLVDVVVRGLHTFEPPDLNLRSAQVMATIKVTVL